ncbi:MAG: radical SAM family heme chaperone HemW [Proteobacteria bacterium]|nr:radical SAM family heme chaperone HemW [Pseudomonadota bacterium]
MFGIYLHWPFCESKCPYCDFNSHVAAEIDVAAWRKAYFSEIGRFASLNPGREVTSIFFGGGTPSLMPPSLIADLIDEIGNHWSLDKDVEITAEANPGSSEAALFEDFKLAGVNRLSIGMQSLNDDALKFLGRRHSAAEGRAAIEAARRVMPRYSLDLIYARPGQSAKDWELELTDALGLAGDHISAYQLTIEPGTDFHRQRIPAADEDIGADLFDVTQRMLEDAGLPAYEISNHARPGAECRHNLVYWQGYDYVGLGPGAHGRLTNDGITRRIQEIRDPARWMNAVETKGTGTQKSERLDAGERRDELLLMGLRLTDGVENDRFKSVSGETLEDALDPDAVKLLSDGGFLTFDGQRLAATPEGLRRLNAVLSRLLT